MTNDDDDIQAYVKPWVGLTRDEGWELIDKYIGLVWLHPEAEKFLKAVEAKLKERNI